MEQHQAEQHLHYRGPRWTGEREGPENLFEDIMDEKRPLLGDETDSQNPGSPESSKKKINSKKLTKIYYN